MAVKLRLMRMGAKKRPSYRIVATDSHRKRDGKSLFRRIPPNVFHTNRKYTWKTFGGTQKKVWHGD